MEGNTLKIKISYDVINDKFDYISNIKPDQIKKIVSEFVRTQVGAGEDSSEAEEHDSYSVNLSLDLSHDRFSISDNCGNKGLRDGILLHFIKFAVVRLEPEQEQKNKIKET